LKVRVTDISAKGKRQIQERWIGFDVFE